ncbi:MAG: glutamate-5-semialdehyde dehydrogenase [Polyangiaceae bacterium]
MSTNQHASESDRTSVRALAERARVAARTLAASSRAVRDAALMEIAARLDAEAGAADSAVLAANRADLDAGRAAGMEAALVDRLALSPKRLAQIAAAVREIAAYDDPIGQVIGMARRPNGLLAGRVRAPLGVIAIVYEARPNVTIDAAALTLKSGNAVLLRGGKEAARSNAALLELARGAIAAVGLPADAATLVPPGDREEIRALVGLTGLVDLAIPRGGEALIRFVTEHARVPVIQHFKGVCHVFVDEGADLDMAARIVEDGKLVRPSVCNALECLLVHAREAEAMLPRVAKLVAERGLEVRADARGLAIGGAAFRAACDEDFGQEFGAPILALRVVDGLDEALEHIARYGSNHTEAIVTKSWDRAQRFLREVDASCVLVNASTRFNDGGELGLGAEMGISTSKLHAYGPMGLEHLTTLKWIVHGEGQVRGG